MQTAALSRRLRNHVVTKGRCRQAPRQRVASHNTRSCSRPARRGAPAPWPDTSSAACAHIPVRASFVSHARCAWTHGTASARSAPRACTRAAHAYTAACALCAHAWRLHARKRVGLTLRVQAEPASLPRQSQQKAVSRNKHRGDPDDTGRARMRAPVTPPGKASPSGLRPDTPSAGHPFPLLTRCRRRRRACPAEAEPDTWSAAPCSPIRSQAA